MINRLGRHFEKHNARTPWDFCWRTAIEGMLLSFAVVIVLGMFVREPPRDMVCLLYTSPSPRDLSTSRMPSSA